MHRLSLQFPEITLQIANCRENTRETVSLLTASSANQSGLRGLCPRGKNTRDICAAHFSRFRGTFVATPLSENSSGIRVVRSDRINRQISDPRISSIRPIFVTALVAAMLPTCTQSCDALSSGEQFSIAADLFAHPMSIYWRNRLFSKTHSPSSLLARR